LLGNSMQSYLIVALVDPRLLTVEQPRCLQRSGLMETLRVANLREALDGRVSGSRHT